ncbi:piggyBac transposable element-derived protein 2-like [Dermacentor albipictus]|uniref:piggyBac transposable element-derived protein 2-like n=1 Tax=Dermacentor albipictus TaxID=60249 RepID=UPI0038FD0A9E
MNVAVETSRTIDGNMCKSTQTLPVAKRVHRWTETTNVDVRDGGPRAQEISDSCVLPRVFNMKRSRELTALQNNQVDGHIKKQHDQCSVHVTMASVKAVQTEATLLSRSCVDTAFRRSGIDCKDVSKPSQASHAAEKAHLWTEATDLRNFQDSDPGAQVSPEMKRKKMDVLAFYRAMSVEKHAKRRKKLDDKSADAVLLKIGNGDISDVDFSDDEFNNSDVEEVDNNISNAVMAEALVQPAISNPTDMELDMSTPSTKLSVKWVDGELAPSHTACSYQPRIGSLPREPLAYFSQYFSVEIFDSLAKFTNLYALQRNGDLVTTKEELKVFFGILMLMGVLKFPRVRMYWQASTRIPAIADAMSAKRFFKIRVALHIADSNAPQDGSCLDKFWKVRPMLEAIRQRCLQLEPLEHSSIDEQHVAVTGRVPRKRLAKGKRHPKGFKMFVRCSADGLAHDLELYQGTRTGVSAQHTDFGNEGSVVMRLVEGLPKGMNMKCFMGSYFTSVELLLQLKEIGILATGAIRPDRLPGCMLKSEREMKKKGRGSIDAKVSEARDITAVRWQDNSLVNVVSTHVGVGNPRKVKRWREATKSYVEIDCPEVIVQYNAYIVGVDKLDFLMSLYPLHIRTRKWPVRVMSHLVGFALCNSWIEYVRDCSKAELPRKSIMDLLAFQSDLAHSLITCNKASPKECGRSSNQSPLPTPRRSLPPNSVRYDGFHHWPEHVTASCAQRCRREGCTSKCRIRCRKCRVFLCLSLQNDCFFLFHNK